LLKCDTAVKSKVVKDFDTGKPAARMRVYTALLAQAAASSSVSRSKYCS
jgi:hypothetical protein